MQHACVHVVWGGELDILGRCSDARPWVSDPNSESQPPPAPDCHPTHLPRLTSCMRHTVSSGDFGMVPTTWSVPTALGLQGAARLGTAWLRPLGGIESTRR